MTVFHLPYCRLIFVRTRGFRECVMPMPISKGCLGGFAGIGMCRTRSETVSGLSVGSYDSTATALMPVVCCHPQLPSQHQVRPSLTLLLCRSCCRSIQLRARAVLLPWITCRPGNGATRSASYPSALSESLAAAVRIGGFSCSRSYSEPWAHDTTTPRLRSHCCS